MTDAKQKLIVGNARFVAHGDAPRRIETAQNGQHPYAVILCCADSRVVPELIFDAGIGDLFVIRVAGNVVGPHALGSAEYAVEHLHVRQIVVLGHTGCGAIGAALSGEAAGWTADLVSEIKSAIGTERDPLRACERNVRCGVQRLLDALSGNDVRVDGAVYDIRTGAVRWMED